LPDHAGQGFAAARELDRLLSGKARRRNDIVCRHIGISERDSTAVISPGVRIVREVNTYLDGHALKPIRVADIVAHVGVSSRLANLRYSKATGRSIQEELITRRLTEAKRLLEKTSWPMTRIAIRCGFKSSIILAHLFSSHFNMSMSAWRNTHGEI
jgi:transcriptional regulator GlxA family with amidase domain